MADKTTAPLTLPGRPSDLVSYSGALFVFLAVTILRGGGTTFAQAPLGMAGVATCLWCCHFVRRIAECLWVHRYANRRVPLSDGFGEYAYYWGFSAWNAWSLGANASAPMDLVGFFGVLLFVLGETGNSWAHLKLRALRQPNTLNRGIPYGGLFNWVSCANYTYEIIAWLGFAILTRQLAAWVYLVGVVLVLAGWAKKRQHRYHALFDGREGRLQYPRSRRALIPFVFFVV